MACAFGDHDTIAAFVLDGTCCPFFLSYSLRVLFKEWFNGSLAQRNFMSQVETHVFVFTCVHSVRVAVDLFAGACRLTFLSVSETPEQADISTAVPPCFLFQAVSV